MIAQDVSPGTAVNRGFQPVGRQTLSAALRAEIHLGSRFPRTHVLGYVLSP